MSQATSRMWAKRALLVLTAAAVVAGFAYALMPRPVPVDTTIVDRGNVRVSVEEEAKTRIKDVYVVSAPASGKVLRSPLEAGDEVIADKTTVALIEPSAPPFLDARTRRELDAHIEASQAAVDLAQAELRNAQSELYFAERELNRSILLSKTSVISERALEKARLDVETRKAQVARAQASVQVRQRELESIKARRVGPEDIVSGPSGNGCCIAVSAPVNGRVLRVVQRSEQVVIVGTPLVEIGDPASLEIVAELLSTDAVRVAPGAKARIEGWGGPPVSATLSRVEPAGFTKVSALGIEEQRVRVILELSDAYEIWSRLGHDYRVFVSIMVYEASNVLRVPISALFRNRNAWALYVVENGRARLRTIELGARNPNYAEVTSGAAEGERIILHPSDRVQDSVRVTERVGEQER